MIKYLIIGEAITLLNVLVIPRAIYAKYWDMSRVAIGLVMIGIVVLWPAWVATGVVVLVNRGRAAR